MRIDDRIPTLTVITPVGPGHQQYVDRCQQSVIAAGLGEFGSVRHFIAFDSDGKYGRSKARNKGIKSADSDWLFFLDADDLMRPYALYLNDFWVASTFGAVSLDGTILDSNVWPCTWADIARGGACGTLTMGCFCRRDVALELLFDQEMNAGEDFDFYMRLPSFTKRRSPLVDIGYSTPSAGGPRGYKRIDWTRICNEQIAKAVAREPQKFDLGGDAVLEKARGAVA